MTCGHNGWLVHDEQSAKLLLVQRELDRQRQARADERDAELLRRLRTWIRSLRQR